MKEWEFTEAQAQCLRDQVITAEQPGSVLRDFRMLLEFVGTGGVAVGGKHNLLPMKFIDELDQRLSRPLKLQLQRPQLRSHPYLQGLHLLLRSSGLSRVTGSGTKARLVLDPDMLAQWDRLNPTEQYFHLLEAWLRIGRAEMVGERGSFWGNLFLPCLELLSSLPQTGRKFDLKKPHEVYLPGIGRDYYQMALMDLFGLLEVKHPTRPSATWTPVAIHHVPFGDAVFSLLASDTVGSLSGEDDFPEDEDEDEEPEGGGLEVPRFGLWQPLFQPYFPEWREVLTFPEVEARGGVYIFRVSLGKVWRLLALPAAATLDDLVGLVLHSYKFDADHLYEFIYRDRMGAEARASHPAMDEGPWATEIPVETLPLEPGQTMRLIYDFGDNWQFTVKLERIDPPNPKLKSPRLLESHGQAPEQYPNWDE